MEEKVNDKKVPESFAVAFFLAFAIVLLVFRDTILVWLP